MLTIKFVALLDISSSKPYLLIQGTPHGAYRLGRAYLRGTGVDQNYELALEYLKKAADEMHVAATTELAKMYYRKC